MAQCVVGFHWSCHCYCCEQGVWCCQQSRGGSGLGKHCHCLTHQQASANMPAEMSQCKADCNALTELLLSLKACLYWLASTFIHFSKVGDFIHNHTYRLLQHMHILQMMQQAMKAAMKNMGGQPGQPGANPFGAGGMPGGMPAGFPGMPPNMQGGMGQGWPPAVDTTARPAGQHNVNLCLQALRVVRHMHNASPSTLACTCSQQWPSCPAQKHLQGVCFLMLCFSAETTNWRQEVPICKPGTALSAWSP